MTCEHARAGLDQFQDRELNTIDSGAIGQHLVSCKACADMAEQRETLRLRVRNAVRNVDAPPDLGYKVHDAIVRGEASRNSRKWLPALIAVAAALMISVGAFYFWPAREAAKQNVAARVSDQVPLLMQVGLRQHVHCGVLREYPKDLPTLLDLARAEGSNAGLIDAVERNVPDGVHVVMAHRCSYEGREYTHVIARGEGHLMSLLITKREGGDIFEKDLKAVASELDTPIYAAGTPKYSIDAFATSGDLVFLVSDLDATQNLAALKAMTPQVRAALL